LTYKFLPLQLKCGIQSIY